MFTPTTQAPNPSEMTQSDYDALSKNEGRRLAVMCVLFVISLVFVVQLFVPKKRDPREVKIGTALPPEMLAKKPTLEPKAFQENSQVINEAKDFQRDSFEDDILHYFVHRVHVKESKQSLAKQKQNIKYRTFADPKKCEQYRGEVKRLNGRVLSYWQRLFETYPNDSGLGWIWQALMQTDDGIYMVVITDKDTEPELGRMMGDAVQVDAVFAKGYEYTDGKGRVLRVPVFVGRDFRRTRSVTYDEAYPYPITYAFAFLTFFMLFAGLIVHFYFKRSDKAIHTQRLALQRKRMARNQEKQANKEASKNSDKDSEKTEPVTAADKVEAAPPPPSTKANDSPESKETSTPTETPSESPAEAAASTNQEASVTEQVSAPEEAPASSLNGGSAAPSEAPETADTEQAPPQVDQLDTPKD